MLIRTNYLKILRYVSCVAVSSCLHCYAYLHYQMEVKYLQVSRFARRCAGGLARDSAARWIKIVAPYHVPAHTPYAERIAAFHEESCMHSRNPLRPHLASRSMECGAIRDRMYEAFADTRIVPAGTSKRIWAMRVRYEVNIRHLSSADNNLRTMSVLNDNGPITQLKSRSSWQSHSSKDKKATTADRGFLPLQVCHTLISRCKALVLRCVRKLSCPDWSTSKC